MVSIVLDEKESGLIFVSENPVVSTGKAKSAAAMLRLTLLCPYDAGMFLDIFGISILYIFQKYLCNISCVNNVLTTCQFFYPKLILHLPDREL